MPAFLLVDVLLADYAERRMKMGGACESECIRPCGCRKIMRGGGHNNFHRGILKVPVKTFF